MSKASRASAAPQRLLVLAGAWRRGADELRSLEAPGLECVLGQQQVLGTRLGVDGQTPRPRPVDLLHDVPGGDVHEDNGDADQLGHRHRAVRRFALADHGMRLRVVLRRGEPLLDEPVGQPLDELGVLRVDHRHRLLAAHCGQEVEHLAVRELEPLVGHVELVGGISLAHERGQLLVEHLRGGVGHDGVECVVDEAAPFRALAVVRERLAERRSAFLEREGNDGRGAAAGGRPRPAEEVVGDLRPVGEALLEMDVAVDAARGDRPAGGVDLLAPAVEGRRDGRDLPRCDADVGGKDVRWRRDGRVADYQVEVGHDVKASHLSWGEPLQGP